MRRTPAGVALVGTVVSAALARVGAPRHLARAGGTVRGRGRGHLRPRARRPRPPRPALGDARRRTAGAAGPGLGPGVRPGGGAAGTRGRRGRGRRRGRRRRPPRRGRPGRDRLGAGAFHRPGARGRRRPRRGGRGGCAGRAVRRGHHRRTARVRRSGQRCRPARRRRCAVRPRAARRALPLGCDRSRPLGLLRAGAAVVPLRGHLAPPHLAPAVPGRRPRDARRPAARRPGVPRA